MPAPATLPPSRSAATDRVLREHLIGVEHHAGRQIDLVLGCELVLHRREFLGDLVDRLGHRARIGAKNGVTAEIAWLGSFEEWKIVVTMPMSPRPSLTPSSTPFGLTIEPP